MWLYRWVLRVCPGAFRRDYGAAMEEMFARRIAYARRVGVVRTAYVWCRELAGLLALIASERWDASARRRGRYQQMQSRPQVGMMELSAQEIRHAARRLARTPLFTLAAATTLALAIAANAAIFTLVHRVVLNPLPYADSERLLALDYGIPSRNVPSGVT